MNATIDKSTIANELRIKCHRSSPRCSKKLIEFLVFAVFIESFTGQKSEKQSVVPSQSAENWRILKGNKPHAYVGELGRPFKDLFRFFRI